MDKKWILVIIVLAISVGIAVYIFYKPSPPDCSFSERKKTIGVDIDVAVGDVEAIKSKVGITDEQARNFDALMKDFALKYDAACMDMKQGRMNQAEYSCRRNNMDKVLDKIRIFLTKIEAAKILPDPAAQRDVVLKALDDLEASTKSGYGAGCTSAMVVDPNVLNFGEYTSKDVVQVTTAGNNPLNFTVGVLPNGFVAQPKTGTVTPGNLAVVAIYRTNEPVTAQSPLTFHVLSNFEEDVPVQINLDARNAALYDNLADQARRAAAAQNHPPSLNDALSVVDKSFKYSGPAPTGVQDSMRYFLAAGVLSRIGNTAEAHRALDTAVAKNPSLAKEPSTLILRGIVANQEGDPGQALKHFAEANRLAPAEDSGHKALSGILSGAVTLKKDENAATTILAQPDVQKAVKANPKVLDFASEQLKVGNLNKAVRNAAPPVH